MSQFPVFRVQETYAFDAIDIDFAGPLYIMAHDNSLRKVYIASFKCDTTRAVHIEVVPDLTTRTFPLCLQRFVCRRGIPRLIVTDNAKIRLFKLRETSKYL